ncbi:MAG: DNA methyltransferase, partial [Moorellaceae bacterium]
MDSQPLPGSFDLDVLPGRPLLYWAGKQPLRTVKYCEARLKERYGVPGEDGWVNRLYWGDNLQVMCHLLREFRGKIKLIYIDPPFDSKAEYRKKIRLKGAARIGGSPSVIEEKQYSDMWADDQYLQFIYERLQLMRELLSPEGSLYVHIDYRRGHYIKVILDEVFGAHNFRNEIVVRRATKNLQSQFEEVAMLNVATDSIFWYS